MINHCVEEYLRAINELDNGEKKRGGNDFHNEHVSSDETQQSIRKSDDTGGGAIRWILQQRFASVNVESSADTPVSEAITTDERDATERQYSHRSVVETRIESTTSKVDIGEERWCSAAEHS